MVLSQKWPFLHLFFLGNKGQENVSYDMLEQKKNLFRLKKQEVQKVGKLTISKGVNPLFWSKNCHYSNFIFLGNIGQENVFYDIVEGKNAFLGYKNKKSKQSEN